METQVIANGKQIAHQTIKLRHYLPFPTVEWARLWYTLQALLGEPAQQPYTITSAVQLQEPIPVGQTFGILYEVNFSMEPPPVYWTKGQGG